MGKLYIVGIGPGEEKSMTAAARRALEESDCICGYTLYTELLRPLYPQKAFWSTGMTGELERCRECLRRAEEGETIALVCSGDAGVYGMASPVLELAPAYPGAVIEVIPGVTAALSGAALLGAPLGHDFCVISLSDRLTDWQTIERRLRLAARGGFVICLYNPASRQRRDHLKKACEILLEEMDADTVCGLARRIGREGESYEILSLGSLRDADCDMFATVYIGSDSTREIAGRMVTPRGDRS